MNNGKPEPRPGGFCGKKWIVNRIDPLFGNTATGVCNLDADETVHGRNHFNVDSTRPFDRLGCIQQKISENLTQMGRIHFDPDIRNECLGN